MQRQQVDAAPLFSGRPEPPLELADEVARRPDAVVERDREPHEAGEIGLADELPFTQLVGRPLEPPRVLREPADPGGERRGLELTQPFEQPACGLPPQQRCTLEWDLRLVKRLFEVDQPRIRPAEDGGFLERQPLVAQHADPVDHELDLGVARCERA